MAKLKAPLLSLGASGKLANALVFMHWKGIDDVREYVIPTNPKSTKQTLQRDDFTDAVEAIHAAQALEDEPLAEIDMIAYSQLGLTKVGPRTWFNQIISDWRKQFVLGLKAVVYRGAVIGESNKELTMRVDFSPYGAEVITAGKFWYGKTRTALINSEDATIAPTHRASMTISELTNGQKYFIQFRPTAEADYVGSNSGIYTGTPHA